MQTRKVGRPTAADAERRQIEEIFERHANGEDLVAICQDAGLTIGEFRRRVRQDTKLREEWVHVRRDHADALFDQLEAINNQLRNGRFGKEDNAKVSALRAAQDGIKHVTSRLNPASYGEQKSGPQAPTIIINTSLPVGSGDKAPTILDGDFTAVVALPK